MKRWVSPLGILNDQGGAALLITLAVMAVMFSLSFEINRRIRLHIQVAEHTKARAVLRARAESGLEIAKTLLVKDAMESRVDSLQEDWARPSVIEDLLAQLGYSPESLSLSIVDEVGKIQVNALVRQFPGHGGNPEQRILWARFLSFFIGRDKSEDPRDSSQIINCITDWIDSRDDDRVTGVSGAESDYYQGLDPPYFCPNAPLYDLKEMLKIKGVSPALLTVAGDRDNFLSREEASGPLEFQDVFTVFGAESLKKKGKGKYAYPGKININTAPAPVIAGILPFGRSDAAVDIAEFRLEAAGDGEGFKNDISQPGWYARVAGLSAEEKAAMEKKICYGSAFFRIESRARNQERGMTVEAVVRREKDKKGRWQCRTLLVRERVFVHSKTGP